jgi:sigma-E factor negative regulatory protein RseB
LALGVLVTPVLAGSSEAARTDVVPGSDAQAVALLDGAVRAESTVSYRGSQDVVALDHLPGLPQRVVDETVDVAHVAGEGTLLVQHSTTGVTVAGFTDPASRRPALLLPLLQGAYRLAVDGAGEVAGRQVRVVAAVRADGSPAARFWVDDHSGLLLRRDLVDHSGATVASAGFRTVQVGAVSSGPDVDYLPPLLPAVATAVPDDATLAGWSARGWPCPRQLGVMTLYDARTVTGEGADGAGALHLAYSDGLSTVSVFVQPGTLDAAGLTGVRTTVVAGQQVLVREGHPRTLFWSADGYVLTVVSDAPADDLAEVVEALPHPTAAPAGWSRVERGLDRVVSWVNPFD